MAKKRTNKSVPRKRSKQKRLKHTSGIPRGGYQKNAVEASIGNEWWKLRSKHGRDKLFTTPELMLEAACEYFRWCEENPLYEQKAFSTRSGIKTHKIPKLRVFTVQGLCMYFGCSVDYLRSFKNQGRKNIEEFLPVITFIEQTIYRQKFEAAAVDLVNANLISRDLGLADRQEVAHQGDSQAPIINVYNSAPPLSDSEDKVDTEKNMKK